MKDPISNTKLEKGDHYYIHPNMAPGSFFPLQSYSKKTLTKNVPKSARKYKWNVLMPAGHPIILRKSNSFNMAAVSVKGSIGYLTSWHNDWLSNWLTDWLCSWVPDWVCSWVPDWLTEWLIEQLTYCAAGYLIGRQNAYLSNGLTV